MCGGDSSCLSRPHLLPLALTAGLHAILLLSQVRQYNWFWVLEGRGRKGHHFQTCPRALSVLILSFPGSVEATYRRQQSTKMGDPMSLNHHLVPFGTVIIKKVFYCIKPSRIWSLSVTVASIPLINKKFTTHI